MKQFIRLMKALSDPNRVKIVKMLQRRRICVCEVHAALGVAQPTASNHLKVLEDAGLVQGTKEGQWVYYALAEGETIYAKTLLGHLNTWLEDDPDITALLADLDNVRRESCSSRPGN